ncbi:MAG: hypothetical protein KAQ78_08455, partial [Candidatus Latescibacteria bacterium]|nr:hypothetical protein [Candidatus Latescibacterota bacterium]
MNRKTIVSLILAFVLVVAFSSSALAAFADILSSVSGWDILEKAGGSDDNIAAIGDTIVVTIKLVSDKAAVQPDLIDGNAIKIEKTGGVTVAVDSIATISAKEFKVLYIVDSGDEDIENTRLYVGTTYYPSTRTSGINIEGIAPVITGSSSITVAPGTPAAIGDTLTYAIGTASESGVTVTAGFGWDADADSAITLSGTVATAVGSGNALTATYIVTAGDTTMADVYGWAFITDAAGNQVGTTSIGYNLDLDGEAPVISGDVVAGALADSARFYAYGVTSTEGIWVETVTELGVANLTGTYDVDLTYTPVDSTHAGVTLDASGGEVTGTLAAETDLTGVAVTTAAVLVDGVTYDIAYKATDSQTNAGATGTVASVRYDATAPTLTVFPNSTDVAELNNTVNDVIISWSEPCDSVSFKYIAAEDGLEVSQDSVVFSHAFNSAQAAAYGSGPYEWAVSAVPEDSLVYTLWVYARDYAGNEVTWKDTLLYAEAYPEPVLKQFILAASANDSVLAGETITVTITATDTAGTDRTVKTFKDTVALSMSGGSLFTWGGDAAVVAGDSLLATISP